MQHGDWLTIRMQNSVLLKKQEKMQNSTENNPQNSETVKGEPWDGKRTLFEIFVIKWLRYIKFEKTDRFELFWWVALIKQREISWCTFPHLHYLILKRRPSAFIRTTWRKSWFPPGTGWCPSWTPQRPNWDMVQPCRLLETRVTPVTRCTPPSTQRGGSAWPLGKRPASALWKDEGTVSTPFGSMF